MLPICAEPADIRELKSNSRSSVGRVVSVMAYPSPLAIPTTLGASVIVETYSIFSSRERRLLNQFTRSMSF